MTQRLRANPGSPLSPSMLRRADSVHRQLVEHVFTLKRLKKCHPFPLNFPPFVIQCANIASAAQSFRSNYTRTSNTTSYKLTRHHLYLPPRYSTPSDILVILAELLEDIDRNLTLEKFRASPRLLHHATDHESIRKLAESLAATNQPSTSFRFLTIVHALGNNTKPNAYEAVCFQMASKRQWDAVLSAVSLAELHLSRLTSRLLGWRTRAYVETRNYASLERILDEFRKYDVIPKRRTFHLILSGHLQNSNLSMAKRILQIMVHAGCPPNASSHALIAMHYRNLGREPEVEDHTLRILPEVMSTTMATVTLNSLLRIRLDTHDLPGALQLLAFFDQNQVGGIISAMKSTQEVQDQRSAKFPHHHTSDRKLLPSAKTYSIFIDRQVSEMKLSSAFQLFKSMLTAGVDPTSETVASLIHLYFAAGKGDTAVRMVADMCRAKGVSPALFEPIISSLTVEDLPWKPSSLIPNIRVFNALLRGTLCTHGLEGAGVVLCAMHATNIKPTAATLRIIMAHVRTEERSTPGTLLRLLRRHIPSNARITLQHLHVILSSVLRLEKFLLLGSGWDHVAARYSPRRRHTLPDKQYPEHRLSVQASSFEPTAGIELPWALSYKQLAYPLIEDLRSRGVLSDQVMFSLRIRHEALIKSDIGMAKVVFRTLLDRGMHPNEYHFSALMEGLANSGDMDGAVDIMKSAIRAGVKPNVAMFTILIVGHGRQGRPDKAIRVFNDMLASDISPDVPAIDAVASAFFVVGGYSMSKKVLTYLWSHIQPFPQHLRNATLKDLAQIFRALHEKNRIPDKLLSKQERLTLHFKLGWLKKIWENQSTKLPRLPISNPLAKYRVWRTGRPKQRR